jgi:hypothetical protein
MVRNSNKKTPPRNSVANSSKSMEDLQEEMNEKLSALMEEVKLLTNSLRTVKKENEEMKQTIQNQADEIADLRNNINDREIHARSWSIRALNIPIPEGQESNNGAVMEAVYKELVAPILEGAKSKGEITSVPPLPQSHRGGTHPAREEQQEAHHHPLLLPLLEELAVQVPKGICSQRGPGSGSGGHPQQTSQDALPLLRGPVQADLQAAHGHPAARARGVSVDSQRSHQIQSE